MSNPPLRHSRLCARLLLGATLCTAVLAVPVGCGGEDGTEAIRQARIDLETLSSTVAGKSGGRQVTYEQVIKNLAKVAESSRAGNAAAAKLLRARAKFRLAVLKEAEASEMERRTLDQVVSIRAAHDRWLSLNADAAALEKFDPKPMLADLDTQIAEKDQEINEVSAQKARSEGVIADLNAKARAATDKGKAEHDEEARIRQSSLDKSETERAELLKAAMERRRKGDGFDREAANLGAEIAKEQPNLAAIGRRIERLSQQRQLLEAGKKQINDSMQVNFQQAAKAREAAAAVAADLVKWTGELKELRAGIAGPSDEAVRFYSDAFNEANKAGAGAGQQRAAAALAAATSKQAMADALLSRARGYQAHGELLALLVATTPPIPGADFKAEADEVQKAFTDMLTQAKEAFTAAEGLYSNAGGSAEVKGRLEHIAKTLRFLATGKEAPAEPAAGAAPAEGDPNAVAATPPPAEAPAPAGGPEAEIRAMLTQLVADAAAGKADAIAERMTTGNDADKPRLEKVAGLVRAAAEFNAACISGFGSDLKGIVEKSGGNPMLAGLAAMSPVGQIEGGVDSLQIAVTSETEAEVTAANQPAGVPPQKLVKGGDGQWRCLVPREQMAMVDVVVAPLRGLYTTMTENIKSGKYDDEAKMLADLQVQAMAVFAKIQPPPK